MKYLIIFLFIILLFNYWIVVPLLIKQFNILMKECGYDAEGLPLWFLVKKKNVEDLVPKKDSSRFATINRTRIAILFCTLAPFAAVLLWIMISVLSFV